ncbi:MAG: hypothetical protein ACTSWY_08055 [Promethearchaeota archaeon]
MSQPIILYFTTRVGFDKKSIPFNTTASLLFVDVVAEVCKKLNISQQSLSLATPGGLVLSASDFNKTVNMIVEEFGTAFEVIDQGIVGI